MENLKKKIERFFKKIKAAAEVALKSSHDRTFFCLFFLQNSFDFFVVFFFLASSDYGMESHKLLETIHVDCLIHLSTNADRFCLKRL